MKCRETQNRLSLYLDDLLDPEESAQIREHLDTCENCSREILELQQIKNALQSIQPVKAPGSLLRSINERIDAESGVAGFQSVLRKFIDFLTMRHAIEAAGVFAVTTVIVIVFLPSVKKNLPPIETTNKKSIIAYRKPVSNKQFKNSSPAAPVPGNMKSRIAKAAPKKREKLKERAIGIQKISPVIVSFALKIKDSENTPLDLNAADDISEEVRSDRKIASRPSSKMASKKARQYVARDYATQSGKVSETDSYKSAPVVLKDKQNDEDTVSVIKKIAIKFKAVVKKSKNKNRLEVTIEGRRLEAFLLELKNTGSLRIVQKISGEWPGAVQVIINYE